MRPVVPLAVILVGASVATVGCRRHVTSEPSGSSPAADAAPTAARPSEPPNALAIPTASVEAVLNPEKLSAYDGPTGIVEGTIYVTGPDAPDVPNVDTHACPAAIDTYGKLFRAGPRQAGGQRPLADAIVAITGYTGHFLAETSPAVRVTIGTNCAYPTTTIAMTFGQRLEIDNASKVVFAPVLEGVRQAAVMIAPPEQHGGPVKLYPPKTGWFGLTDTLQPFVRGNIYVLRHPLHAVSDLSGHYRIEGVPVGKLKVSALLPVLNADAGADVDVRPNVVETIDLTIAYEPREPRDAEPAAGPRRPIIP